MLGFIRKRLGYKIMAAMLTIIFLVLVAEIYMRIHFGTKDRLEIATTLCRDLADAVYTGIKYPMSIGDSEAVKKELSDIREKMKDVEVFISDFEQLIIYSTHEDKVETKVGDSIHNKAAQQTLAETLKTGFEPQKLLEDEVAGRKYLIVVLPILNQRDCYHCHGSSRQVLGSMIVRVSAEQIYKTVAAQRNRTLLLVGFTLPLAVIIITLIVNRFIRGPIESLANKAKRFAEGDMSVSMDVRTGDEIGVLGNSFNYMVKRISSFSKELETEVNRRTKMLKEKTLLLEQANRELMEVDKLKSAFLANMSHELRTPMNAIIGYSELLIDGIEGPINEEQEKSLKRVAANAKHLLQLINDILDISKIESAKVELEIKKLDLKWLIESVTPTFEPLIAQKGLAITYNIDENLPFIYGDEDRIKQILMNLLSNAVKFTGRGGITISTKLSERGITPGEPALFAEVCVEDTGIGIKEEDLGKIFDKFVRADLIRQYEGTGLGLSIVRGLVVLHNGVIWVTSKYGEGSKFCFTLPTRKEILKKPAEPIIEPMMAKSLAEYFNKPVETFLKEPEYAGKPIRCWEYIKCGQTSCPAYESKENRCWLIHGTHCAGMKIAAYPEKVDFCKRCKLIETLMLGPEEEYKPTAAESLKGEEVTTKTVLVIDDNPEAIDIIRKSLGKDYRVVGLLSGEGAVEKAKEIKPLAITLDILMPLKDGWKVLQELKDTPETQDIPVVILSIVDDKQLGFSLGAAEYIVKPVEKQVLLRKLRNLEKATTIKNVLVVDNEPDAVKLIGNLLKKEGYQLTIAYNSEDAIKSIQGSMPDLIIVNLTMPEVSGFDVIEYIKKDEKVKNIPLIAVTHKDLTKKEIDELNDRIQGILNKGVLTKEEILKELKNILIKRTF